MYYVTLRGSIRQQKSTTTEIVEAKQKKKILEKVVFVVEAIVQPVTKPASQILVQSLPNFSTFGQCTAEL